MTAYYYIFIIIKKTEIKCFLETIHGIHPTIKFREEIETDKQIAFLVTLGKEHIFSNTLLQGKASKSISAYIERTQTQIGSLPEILFARSPRKRILFTAWFTECVGSIKRLSFSFIPNITNLLGNTKDKPEQLKQPGIYKVTCPHCLKVYVGQSKRYVEKRFSEHLRCIKYNRTTKSAIALHVWKNDPPHTNIKKQNLELLKHVRKRVQQDAWESLIMKKLNDNLMKVDSSPIISPLSNFT